MHISRCIGREGLDAWSKEPSCWVGKGKFGVTGWKASVKERGIWKKACCLLLMDPLEKKVYKYHMIEINNFDQQVKFLCILFLR